MIPKSPPESKKSEEKSLDSPDRTRDDVLDSNAPK